jgi:hypothetical protein
MGETRSRRRPHLIAAARQGLFFLSKSHHSASSCDLQGGLSYLAIGNICQAGNTEAALFDLPPYTNLFI